MPTSKWRVIAKNQYRLSTSAIRRIRRFFPFIVIGVIAVYGALISGIASSTSVDFSSLMLSQYALATSQIVLFQMFIFLMILPITNTLREVQAGQLEILLAAPIKPSDVLLGEFMGRMPIYLAAIAVISATFTVFLAPLGIGLLQIGIIIVIICIVVLSAMWIGELIAAVLQTKLGKTARGKDVGRAISLLLALPLIAAIYAIRGGGLFEALAVPGTNDLVTSLLSVLPSSWGAEVIISFANNPGNIGPIAFLTLTRLGGLTLFFLAVLWLGARVANRAYSLEPTSFVASRAKLDGYFYKSIKWLNGGGSFGTLVVSIFKDYGRRLENISRVFYIIGLVVLINFFFGDVSDNRGPFLMIFMSAFLFTMLAAFVSGEITVRGKASLFIFKKAPLGIWKFIGARIIQGWIIVIPVTSVVSTLQITLSMEYTVSSAIIMILSMVGISAASVVSVIGIFLLNPAFSIKSGKYAPNMMGVMFLTGGIIVLSTLILENVFLLAPMTWAIAAVFLYLGKKKLSRIE